MTDSLMGSEHVRRLLADLQETKDRVKALERALAGSTFALVEGTAPAGQTDRAILFAIDNGSNKTSLRVQMPTGAAIVLATEV